ncbi:MAG: AI-2E family transporter [Acidimicrobiales bacterium]
MNRPAGDAVASDERPGRVWPVPSWLDRGAGWTWRLLVIGAGVVVLLLMLSRLRIVLLPVLIALSLAAFAAPLTDLLTRGRVPRIVAAWVTLLLLVALIGGVGWFTATGINNELVDNAEWDDVRTEVRTWLRDGPLDLSTSDVTELENKVEGALTDGFTTIDAGRVRLVTEVAGGIFLTIVLLFFFVKDGPTMWRWLVDRVRSDRRAAIDEAGSAAFSALSGYMRGVAITGLVDAVAIGIALWLIGVPLVLPLAVLTFFAAFFPIVGATLAGALATLVALVVNGPVDAILVAAVTLAIQQLEGDIIMPMVMRRQVNLHPAVVLVALGIGGALGGIMGAFVAIPITAMATAGAHSLRMTS